MEAQPTRQLNFKTYSQPVFLQPNKALEEHKASLVPALSSFFTQQSPAGGGLTEMVTRSKNDELEKLKLIDQIMKVRHDIMAAQNDRKATEERLNKIK